MYHIKKARTGYCSGDIVHIRCSCSERLVLQLLCHPINAVVHHFTGINSLNAYLPWEVSLVLIGISVVLTMFAGLIPSRSAAKKDPVVALRSE